MDPLVYTIIICCLSAPHLPFTARLMMPKAISPLSAGTVSWLHRRRPTGDTRRVQTPKVCSIPMDSFLWHQRRLPVSFCHWGTSLGSVIYFNQSLLYAISSVELCTLHYNLSRCQTVHYQDISSLRTGSMCLLPLFYSARHCSRQQQ